MEVEKIGSKGKFKKKGGMGGECGLFCFFLPFSDLIGNELIFPQVASVLSMTVTGDSSLPVLILTHQFFVTFLLPCSDAGGRDGVALVGTWDLVRGNPPH